MSKNLASLISQKMLQELKDLLSFIFQAKLTSEQVHLFFLKVIVVIFEKGQFRANPILDDRP